MQIFICRLNGAENTDQFFFSKWRVQERMSFRKIFRKNFVPEWIWTREHSEALLCTAYAYAQSGRVDTVTFFIYIEILFFSFKF